MIFLFALLAVLLVFYLYKHWKICKLYDTIPGPRPRWPFIGNLDVILKERRTQKDFFTACFRMVVKLRDQYIKEGIFAFYYGSYPVVIIHNPLIIEKILKHNISMKPFHYKFFKQLCGEGLLTSSGSRWKKRRVLLTPAFHFDILNQFLPVMNKHAFEFIEEVKLLSKSGDFINIAKIICNFTLGLICETAMGYKLQKGNKLDEEYLEAMEDVKKLVGERVVNPFYWYDFIFYKLNVGKRLSRSGNIARNFCGMVVDERRRVLSSDRNNNLQDLNDGSDVVNKRRYNRNRLAFLDMLIKIQDETGELTNDDIYDEVNLFIFGGNDTTAMLMTWALVQLGHHPEIQEKIREEQKTIFGDDKNAEVTRDDAVKLKYLEAVIKEALRLYPSIPMIGRSLLEPLNIDGYYLPKGTSVVIPFYLIHRLDENYPDHRKFMPERFLEESERNSWTYLPFSAGARNCIGQKYALLQIKTVLSHIMRNFQIETLEPEHKIKRLFALSLTPVGAVKIKFTPIA